MARPKKSKKKAVSPGGEDGDDQIAINPKDSKKTSSDELDIADSSSEEEKEEEEVKPKGRRGPPKKVEKEIILKKDLIEFEDETDSGEESESGSNFSDEVTIPGNAKRHKIYDEKLRKAHGDDVDDRNYHPGVRLDVRSQKRKQKDVTAARTKVVKKKAAGKETIEQEVVSETKEAKKKRKKR